MLLIPTLEVIDKDDFLSKLIPSWPSFVAQILALLVMIIIVIFVAYKPVKKVIKKRQDYIENNIRDAETNKTLAIQKEAQADQLILTSRKEASEIILEAKSQAELERQKILLEAEREAKEKIKNAELEIEDMKLEAKESMRKEMVNIALDASKEILKRNVTSEDNKRIAMDFIKEVDKK